MTALFKKGDRCDANNYRPITVLPTTSKILEKAVHTQLYGHLRSKEVITSKEFGFEPKFINGDSLGSFHRQHFSEYGHWQFDRSCFSGYTVDHHLLLQKLMNIGLTFTTTQRIRSYLTNRSQMSSQITSVGDHAHSASTEMPVGVPQ